MNQVTESKKKSFSRNALEGDDHFIWSELYDFIYSQMQCVRTEYGVRKHSPLELTNKEGNRYSYRWQPQYTNNDGVLHDRCISKVTMTLKEYINKHIHSLFAKHIAYTPKQHPTREEKHLFHQLHIPTPLVSTFRKVSNAVYTI